MIEKEFFNGYLARRETYTYNEKKYLIQHDHMFYSPGGIIFYKTIYRYDEQDRLIEETTYNPDESVDKIEIYRYDKKGNLIQQKSYGEENSYEEKNTFKYDKQGRKKNIVATTTMAN